MLRNETVPFRLTPNLQTFFTPVGLDSLFGGTITASSLCLAEKNVIFLILLLFFI